jgi:hypothetical protein
MGQMKRLAMQLEDQFYEIASEYMYIAETWAEYRDHMRNQKDELLSHLDDATYYGEVEHDLLNMWNDYQRDYAEENQE